MKSALRWLNPNKGATNISRFTGLPGGYRGRDGDYHFIGDAGLWWYGTEINYDEAYMLFLAAASREVLFADGPKRSGISVRCIR